MKAISNSRQGFRKHIDEGLVGMFVFLLVALVALTVAVMVSECITCYLQQLLGLEEKGKYDVLKFIGFCILGVLLVWQAWATNKRAKAMENTAKSTAAGQQEERLKNAIEHLGHKSDSVRISGAYEFFHLVKYAKDKDTEDKDSKILRQIVFKILCSHIRQTTRENNYQTEHKTKPSEEIQGLLTLLFVQKHGVFKGCPINLQGSYLNGADLRDAQLQRAQLQGADLSGAKLQRADLRDAQLQRAQLQGADHSGAKLQRADLSGTELQRADLSGTELQGTDLSGAEL